MSYVIFDIDGTLANIDHRLHFIAGNNKDWNSFFNAMSHDAVNYPIKFLANAMDCKLGDGFDIDIVLCSGRPENYRKVTEKWLERKGIFYDLLLMRPENDYRNDTIVKREMLQNLRGQFGEDPEFVVDDRKRVVDMWRSEGITCLQCAEWEEKRKYPLGFLEIMVGPSHAGKTYMLRNSDNVVSSDIIRHELCGDYRDQSKNDQVFSALHAIVSARIKSGLLTVVDATNIKNKDRLAVVNCVPKETHITYVVVDRPLKEKLASCRSGFPKEVIEKHHQTFQSNLKGILAGDNLSNVNVLDFRK